MNQQRDGGSKPVTKNESDGESILAHVKTLSHEQLNLYLHETKWLIKQLGYVMVNPRAPYPEVYKQSSHMVTQVDALHEALILEHVRRQLTYLHTEIANLTIHGEDADSQTAAPLDGKPDSSDERNVSEALVQ